MKSFFSRMTPPAKPKPPSPGVPDTPEMLQRAETLLQKLRLTSVPDFPLLNEATRLVQLIEGAVSKMSDGDTKVIWREQVNELQRDLQMATGRMLSAEVTEEPPATSEGPPAATGMSLFEGLSVGAAAPVEPARHAAVANRIPRDAKPPPPSRAAAAPAAPPTFAPPPGTGGDLFSGMNLVAASEPALADSGAGSGLLGAGGSAPLPEDLFTGLAMPAAPQKAPEPASQASSPQPPAGHSLLGSPPRMAGTADSPISSKSAVSPSAQSTSSVVSSTLQSMGSMQGMQGMEYASGVPTAGAAGAADGRRKKKITRRVGYARDDADDSPVKPAAPKAQPPPHGGPARSPAASTAQQATPPRPLDNPLPANHDPIQQPSSAVASYNSHAAFNLQSGPAIAASLDFMAGLDVHSHQQPEAHSSGARALVSPAKAEPAQRAQQGAASTSHQPPSPPATASHHEQVTRHPYEAATSAGTGPHQPGSTLDPVITSEPSQSGPAVAHQDARSAPEAAGSSSGSTASRPYPDAARPKPVARRSTAHAPSQSSPHAASAPHQQEQQQSGSRSTSQQQQQQQQKQQQEHWKQQPPGTRSTPQQQPHIKQQQAESAAAVLHAAQGRSFAEQVALLQAHAQAQIKQLGDGMAQAVSAEQAAKARRRQLAADVASISGQLTRLEEAEALAVEQEDFEAAANLSAELDELKARVAELDRDVRAAEHECELAVARRVQVAVRQAAIWQEAAAALQCLKGEQQRTAAEVAARAAQAAAKAAEENAAHAEHVEELKARIDARQRWIDDEQEAVDRKIEEATRPAASEREARAEAYNKLEQQVQELRAALVQQEAALATAAAALAEVDEQMHALSSKYDKTLARLDEDRQAVAREAAERDNELAALQHAQDSAAAEAEAADQERSKLLEQAEAAGHAAEEMLRQAGAITAKAEAEERARQVHTSLRQAEEQAEAKLRALEGEVESARAAARDLSAKRAGLAHDASTAEEQAAIARRRIPELEAEKKSAAATRDFKEAARLSAEAKALAADAESALQRAQQLRQRAAEVEAGEKLKVDEAGQLEGRIAAAKRGAALARWRRAQAGIEAVRSQLDAAVAADKYEDADALQSEMEASMSEADALAAAYGFRTGDRGDLVAQLESAVRSGLGSGSDPQGSPAMNPVAESDAAGARTSSTAAIHRSQQRQSDGSGSSRPGSAGSSAAQHAQRSQQPSEGEPSQPGSAGSSAAQQAQHAKQLSQGGVSPRQGSVDEEGSQGGESEAFSAISASHAATAGSLRSTRSRSTLARSRSVGSSASESLDWAGSAPRSPRDGGSRLHQSHSVISEAGSEGQVSATGYVADSDSMADFSLGDPNIPGLSRGPSLRTLRTEPAPPPKPYAAARSMLPPHLKTLGSGALPDDLPRPSALGQQTGGASASAAEARHPDMPSAQRAQHQQPAHAGDSSLQQPDRHSPHASESQEIPIPPPAMHLYAGSSGSLAASAPEQVLCAPSGPQAQQQQGSVRRGSSNASSQGDPKGNMDGHENGGLSRASSQMGSGSTATLGTVSEGWPLSRSQGGSAANMMALDTPDPSAGQPEVFDGLEQHAQQAQQGASHPGAAGHAGDLFAGRDTSQLRQTAGLGASAANVGAGDGLFEGLETVPINDHSGALPSTGGGGGLFEGLDMTGMTGPSSSHPAESTANRGPFESVAMIADGHQPDTSSLPLFEGLDTSQQAAASSVAGLFAGLNTGAGSTDDVMQAAGGAGRVQANWSGEQDPANRKLQRWPSDANSVESVTSPMAKAGT